MFYHLFMLFLILKKISTNESDIDDYYDNDLKLNKSLTSASTTKETQILDQTRANLFKEWLDSKSIQLYEMSKNYSAYHLINTTYNTKLRDEVNFAVINFTSMIIDISISLSEVLQKKSLFVEKLSDSIEKAYENYKNNTKQVKKSIESVYYDSKSPKTFCDIFDTYKKTYGTNKNNLTDLNIRYKRSSKKCLNYCASKRSEKQFAIRKPIQFLPKITTPMTTTTTTTTTITTSLASMNKTNDELNNEYLELDDDEFEDDDDEEDDEESLDELYWDIECINRTIDENFQKVQKVNFNQSTIQVPTNIFKQELSINMTAYWTQSLDTQFKENYEQENQLYWQYFCSSNGLFRQYPGSYWTVPKKEDFFDCRLQSWYMMAAASAKDILFLFDVSGSMTGLRLEIGKKLIEFLLDTFSDNDFFNIILYSDSARFLFEDDIDYSKNFIQANKANKNKFRNKLRLFKDTNQQAKLKEPLELAFQLFDNSSLTRTGCNKMLMIITDGQEDNVDELLAKYPNVRIFSFKIGRDMNDLIEIKKLACSNKGEFYHVMTLTDINEHVYEYITVLSRPMALMGVHETKWSNVFIGHLDKVLKIAVARPAFKYNYSYFEEMKLNQGKNDLALSFFSKFLKDNEDDNDNDPKKHLNSNRSFIQFKKAKQILKNQQVLLGVVGIDVPVLKLISSVSPKYQMGVGIYIIMLDNNGYIVYHPSIKKEIATSASDYKGTSNSVDIDIFEIPINNEDRFEQLEHDMIDKYTGNVTLENWKREGVRVIKRRTEYVYTPVLKTPFSVALASPLSFGSYYIDIAKEKEPCFDENIKRLKQSRFDTLIQLYNCSYMLNTLVDKLVNIYTNKSPDYCIKYLLKDSDQILAIKLDLKIHETIYNSFNYTMYLEYPNLVKSSFYGTYSGNIFKRSFFSCF